MSYTEQHLTAGGRELIAFRIGAQEFCVDIMSVREIRGWTPATPLPHRPAYRARRHQPARRGAADHRSGRAPRHEAAPSRRARHVIIVAQIGEQVVGLLVDAVSDILTVTDDMIQPTPGRRLRPSVKTFVARHARHRRADDQPDRARTPASRDRKRSRMSAHAPDDQRSGSDEVLVERRIRASRASDFREIAAMMLCATPASPCNETQGGAGLFAPGQAPARSGPDELPGLLRPGRRRRRRATSASEMLARADHQRHPLLPRDRTISITCATGAAAAAASGASAAAGCASGRPPAPTGQEPYSIALTVLSLMPDAADSTSRSWPPTSTRTMLADGPRRRL